MPTRPVLMCLAASLCVAGAGCDRAEDPPAPEKQEAEATPAPNHAPAPTNAQEAERPPAPAAGDTFRARGEVVALGLDAITIRNEGIPDYPMGEGEPGLDPTERAYTLGEGIDVEGLAPGDPVDFTFSTMNDGLEPALVSIKGLDPSTELDFSSLTRFYDVRGIVVAMPRPGDEDRVMMVRHEAIPNYRGSHGAIGMDVMSMAFPVAYDVDLDDITIGTKVALTFYVDHREDHVPKWYEVIEIEALDPSVELDFTPLGG